MFLLIGVRASCVYAEEVVNMQYVGKHDDHLEHFIPADQPDVYCYNVDSGRTHGDVTVKSGADYEIEASDEVILDGGFSVERGASFSVMPSTYR